MTILISLIIALLIAIGGFYYYSAEIAESPTIQTPSESGQSGTNPPSMPALTTVNRSNQGLTKMPQDILAMTNVQQLNLSNNKLTGALPAEIRQLKNLEVLNISNNQMTGLPAEIGQLSKLRILNASNNQLTGIPRELGNLQNLEILDLSGNNPSEEDMRIIRAALPASTNIIL